LLSRADARESADIIYRNVTHIASCRSGIVIDVKSRSCIEYLTLTDIIVLDHIFNLWRNIISLADFITIYW